MDADKIRFMTAITVGAIVSFNRNIYGWETTPAQAVLSANVLAGAWLALSAGWCIAGGLATSIYRRSRTRRIQAALIVSWTMGAGCAIVAGALYLSSVAS